MAERESFYKKGYEGRYAEIYGIASLGAEVNKIVFTYDDDKDVIKLEFYKADKKLFTLNFSYDGDKDVTEITRSEP